MKIHRFIGDYDFSKSSVLIKDTETIRQIRLVLKLEPGETIILGDGKGTEAEIVIETIHKTEVTGAIISKKITEFKHDSGVTLYLAILKKENFELAVQKSTECGVNKIVPVITERTVKTGLNIDRLNKIAKEASEQSGRSTVPKITEIYKFKDALELGKNSKSKIFFHLGGDTYTPSDVESTAVFIGPEGGFTETEINQAKEACYKVASLGQLTLRGETAAIVATYRAVNGI